MSGEVTPNRRTSLVLTTVEAQNKVRDPWEMSRRAGEMARLARPGLRRKEKVIGTGTAWLLSPLDLSLSNVSTSDYEASGVQLTDVNVASGVRSFNAHRKLTDPGIAAAENVLPVSGPMFVKTVAAGESWHSELTADAAAFAKPTLAGSLYPMDRILSGKVTYPANTPFAVEFFTPAVGAGGGLLTFYFGGPTEALPEEASAGNYCVTLRDDGSAQLDEKVAEGWETRAEFPWSAPLLTPGVRAAVVVVPYGADRMLFIAPSAGAGGSAHGPADAWASVAIVMLTQSLRAFHYQESRAVAKHTHRSRMTGAGPIRVDVRRDLRMTFGPRRLLFPGAGTIVDDPFDIPDPVTAGMTLGIEMDVETPSGTAVTVTLVDAADDAQLAQDEEGFWVLVEGHQHYYCIFDLTSETGDATPVLQSYTVKIAGLMETGTPEQVVLDVDFATGVQVTGCGSDPSTGNALVTVMDVPGPRFGDAFVLQRRARIKAELQVHLGGGVADYTVLHSGETVDDGVEALLRVTDNDPAIGRWFEYGVPIGPEWGRVADQFMAVGKAFHQDPTADPVDGRQPPWKITDIIRYLFNRAGVDDEHLDIPDLPQRLWFGPGFDPEDFMLQPAVKFAQAILKYARDYLDMWVAYDPNTNPARWRLLYQPSPPYNPIFTFRHGPTAAGSLPHHANSYGANATFILSETWRVRPVAPEANAIYVIGAGGLLRENQGKVKSWAYDWNPNSFNLIPSVPTAITDPSDPRHVDYLGRRVPLLYVDPTITTMEGARYLCRRLLLKVGYGHYRTHFRSPFMPVTDPNDALQARPRPLRPADAVYVPKDAAGTLGIGVLDQAPSVDYMQDGEQWQDVECILARDA